MARRPGGWLLCTALAALAAGGVPGAAAQQQPARPPTRPAPQPPAPQPPAGAAQLPRELSVEVRAAQMRDLLAQLSGAAGVRLEADPGLAGQRVSLHASSTSVAALQSALAALFRTSWRATGEGAELRYRLANNPQLYREAAQLRAERRAQFLTRLLQTERALRTQNNDAVAAQVRAGVARAEPGITPEALAQITPDFLRQALLLAPLRLGSDRTLLRAGSVTVTLRSLPAAHQELLAQFLLEQFESAQEGFSAAVEGAPPALPPAGLPSPLVLNSPDARVEYRFVYGDHFSDELLLVRVGAPDNWATAYLPAILFNPADYASLYPDAGVRPVAAELARKVDVQLDTDAQGWDQALLTVARAAGINVLSDSFPRPAVFRPVGREGTLSAPTLGDLLNRMADHYGYTWWKQGDWYVFRSRMWAEELRVQVPDNLPEALGSSIARAQSLSSENFLALAALSDEQLLSLHLYGSAAGKVYAWLEDLDLNEIRLVRSGLTLYGQLSEQQRAVARTTGLPLGLMTPPQQLLFAGIATERGADLDPSDSADWRFQLTERFERRRLGAGWAEVGGVQLLFDFGQNGSRMTNLAVRAPALEPKEPHPVKPLSLAPVLALVILALPAAAQRPMDRTDVPSLTVNGSSEVLVDPDEATVRLGVTRQAPTAAVAQDQVNRAAQAILDAVLRLGVAKEQIQTSQLSLFPVYAPQRPDAVDEPRIAAYRASNVVSIRTGKLNQVGPIIDAGLKAGANQVEGVSFGLRQDLPARERALRQAVQEARRKADTMANALGVRLGGVLEVQEGGVNIRPQVFAGGALFARGAEAATTPVSPGEVGVTASVTIRYRIIEER